MTPSRAGGGLPAALKRLLWEQIPCPVAVIDHRRQVVLTNPGFDQQFDKDRPCYQALKGLDEPCEVCPALDALDDGAPREVTEQGVTREGEPITYRVKAVPLPGPEGGDHVLLMTQDITRLDELEQGLRQAERLASVGLTMAGMAHTIKNILGGLEGGIYVVDSGLTRDNLERTRGGWAMVKLYIEQLSDLVQNLLRYARPGLPIREDVDPAELVADVLRLFESKAELVGVELESNVKEALPTLRLDRPGMHACLTNLVSNSLDACVWDSEGENKEHRILLSARAAGAGVIFEVQDNGMGISEENQGKILSAFFTTKGIRGTGLGLLLTRKAVQEHGGRVSFTSTLGVGTTFCIELPGDAPTSQSPEETS